MKKLFTFFMALMCTVAVNAIELYMVGDATPAGWDKDAAVAKQQMTEVGTNVFEWTGALRADSGEGFKILAGKDWNPGMHPSEAALKIDVAGQDVVRLPYDGDPDTKWQVSKDGVYTIRVTLRAEDALVECIYKGEIAGIDVPLVDGVFQISTAEQMLLFSEAINDGTVKGSSSVALTQNIDLDGIEKWTAIGTDGHKFIGTFDGQGYRILNMHIDGGKKEQGFFGVVGSGAVIKNLIMDQSCVIVSTGGSCMAAFAGCCNNDGVITFENCGNEANVTGTQQNNAAFMGCNYGGGCHLVFTNCYNTGKISGGWENGAFSGWVGGGAKFTNCWNIGEVTEGEDWARGNKEELNNCYQTKGATVTNISMEDVENGTLLSLLNEGFRQEAGDKFPKLVVDKEEAAAPIEISPALIMGEEEITLNDHSAVSVESATAIKVNFENGAAIRTAMYTICEAVEEDGELTYGDDIASDVLSLSGFGYAEFDQVVNFEQGKQYWVRVMAFGEAPANDEPGQIVVPTPIATYECLINGAYVAPIEITPALINGEEEIALFNGRDASVEMAEAIKVDFVNGAAVRSGAYYISEVGYDEEGEPYADVITSGELSINGNGYAEFEEAIKFEQGKQYQLNINVYGATESAEGDDNFSVPTPIATFSCQINGAYIAPMPALEAGQYFVMENESGLFLSNGANWGTRSVLFGNGICYNVELGEDGKYTLKSGIKGDGKALRPSDGFNDQSGAWELIPTVDGYYMYNGTQYFTRKEGDVRPQYTDNKAEASVWSFVTEAERKAALAEATSENPVDATVYIKGADFHNSDAANAAWSGSPKVDGDNGSGNMLANNTNAEKWNAGEFTVGQTITDLPNGIYKVSCQGFTRKSGASVASADSYEAGEILPAYLFANDEKVALKSIFAEADKEGRNSFANVTATSGELYVIANGQNTAAVKFSEGAYVNELEVEVTDGTLNLGVMSEGGIEWVVFDSFRLTYYGEAPEPIVITPALIMGEEEITLNDHSAVSVESATAIKVNFENGAAIRTAMYDICEAIEEDGELTYGDEIASDVLSLSGFGYAEFDQVVNFEQGKQYWVRVMAFGEAPANDEPGQIVVPTPIATYECLINGAYVAPIEITPALINGEEEIALFNGRDASVEMAEAIKVDFVNGAAVRSGVYYISEVGYDEEGERYAEVITSGELSINGNGYAEFEEVVIFDKGKQYQLDINVYGATESAEGDDNFSVPTPIATFSCLINGAYVKPVPMPKFSEMATDGTVQYLYNVETHTFMAGGNDWGTRASLFFEKGNQVKMVANGDTYKLTDNINNGGNWNAIDCDGNKDSWVDGQGRSGDGKWTVKAIEGTLTYELYNTVAGDKKWGVDLAMENTRAVFNDDDELFGNVWAFVNAEDFDAYIAVPENIAAAKAAVEENKEIIAEKKQAALDKQNAAVLADMAELLNSTNIYEEAGYEAYKAKYEELVAKLEAGELKEALVSPYKATGWHASTAYNFLLTPWQINGEDCNEFAKSLYINTWSTEGDNDGSHFTVPFFEYWTGDDASLGANAITTTVTDLEPGKAYEATAWVRVRVKNGADYDAPNGITFQAGDDEVSVCDGERIGTTQFHIVEASAIGVADEEGKLVVKFNVAADNNISWLSFKNVMVTESKLPDFAINFDVEEGTEVDPTETKSIHISVEVSGVEASDDLVIEGKIYGKNYESPVIGFTDFEDGVDVDVTRLNPGNYTIEITKIAYGEVVDMDPETYMPIYENTFEAEEGESLATLNFSVKEAEQVAPEIVSVTVNPNAQIVAVTFAAEDANVTYNVALALETAAGEAVETTVAGEYGQNYGDMIYTFGEALAAGDYVLVLPAGSMTFSLNGDPFNAEIRIPFTVEGTTPDVVDCDLTRDLFHEWDSYEANGNIVGDGGCDFQMGVSTGMPYGNGSVIGSQYADLSAWDVLALTVTEGAPRLLLNRQDMGGSSSDFLEINNPDSPYVIGVKGGVWYINLAKIVEEKGYAHLNVIKGANWANVTITEAKLIVDGSEIITGISEVETANAKDGKFLKNGKIVIVKNGKTFSTTGARMK